MDESITITGAGTYGIMAICKHRLPCGYCELQKKICTADNPMTIMPIIDVNDETEHCPNCGAKMEGEQ